MAETLSYYDIAKRIDRGENFNDFSSGEIHAFKQILSQRLKDVENDKESLAVAKIYLLVFLIQTKGVHRESEVMKMYEEIRSDFFDEEKKYNKKWNKTEEKIEKSIIYNQMIYFHKIAEFHFAYLEKFFKHLAYHECMLEAYQDRLHFLRRRQLMEGNIKKFLLYTQLSFSAFLKEYAFVYGFASVVGVVLIWHGLSGIYDWMFEYFNVSNSLPAYFVTTCLGIGILSFLGIFLNHTIGDMDRLKGGSELEERGMDDLKTVNRVLGKKIKK